MQEIAGLSDRLRTSSPPVSEPAQTLLDRQQTSRKPRCSFCSWNHKYCLVMLISLHIMCYLSSREVQQERVLHAPTAEHLQAQGSRFLQPQPLFSLAPTVYITSCKNRGLFFNPSPIFKSFPDILLRLFCVTFATTRFLPLSLTPRTSPFPRFYYRKPAALRRQRGGRGLTGTRSA